VRRKCQSVVLRLDRKRPRVVRRVPTRINVRMGRGIVVLPRNSRVQASGVTQRRKPERAPISVIEEDDVVVKRMTE
jgi:hypothetical protein